MKSRSVTIQMKLAFEQYFPVVLFIIPLKIVMSFAWKRAFVNLASSGHEGLSNVNRKTKQTNKQKKQVDLSIGGDEIDVRRHML